MAQYQIGSEVYEIPDGTPAAQVQQIINQLAAQQSSTSSPSSNKPSGPDTSFSSAFMSGIDRPLENIGETLKATGLAPELGQTLQDATDAPSNYQSASSRFINPEEGDASIAGFGVGYLPRAVTEQAGNLAGSLISRGAGAAIGSTVGPGGAVVGALAGPALFEFAQQLGPVAIQRAKNNGRSKPNWDDWTYAAGTAGVSGTLNAIGVGGGQGASLLNKTIREGITEGSQSVVEQAGTTVDTDVGLQIDAKQAVGEGIIGGTTAGSIDTAGKTLAAPAKIFAEDGPTDAEAASGFANDLQRLAKEEGYNLKDVGTGSTQGARAAIDDLNIEYNSQIEFLVKDLQDRLEVTADNSQADALNKVKANAAKRKAKNKVKNRVNQSDFETIESLTEGTLEGAQIIELMRKSNELTEMANQSLKGGISQFTDVFNPLDTDGRFNVGRTIAAPVSGLGAFSSGGASLIPAVAGRGIDALTGRRSRVARFVDQNKGGSGIKVDQSLPSVRAAKALEIFNLKQQEAQAEQQKLQDAQDLTEANVSLFEQGAGATGGSPQATVEAATGLDRQGVEDVLAAIEATNPVKAIAKAIAEYRVSVRQGGPITNKMLSPLIRNLNLVLDSDPKMAARRVREPVGADGLPTTTQQIAQPAIDPQKREAGKQDNLKVLNEIETTVNADKSLPVSDKARVKEALSIFRTNLGANPVETITGVINEKAKAAKNTKKVRTYLTKYLTRVKRQQRSSQFNGNKKAAQKVAQ